MLLQRSQNALSSRASNAVINKPATVVYVRPRERGVCALASPNVLPQSMEKVVVFTTPGCPYCKRAKQALAENKVAFQDIDVSTNSSLRQALKEATGHSSVPQIYANGSHVGGSDTLLAKIKDGSFNQLLSQSASSAVLPPSLNQALQQPAAAAKDGTAASAGTQLSPELQQLLHALSDHRSGVPRQAVMDNGTFTGKVLLDWLLQYNSSASNSSSGSFTDARSVAAATAQQLLEANAITVVTDKQPQLSNLVIADDTNHLYRLRSEAPRQVSWGSALNTHYWWGPKPARSAEIVAEDLRGRILSLYDNYLSSDGKAVKYKALKQDVAFWEYVDATAELQQVDLTPLSREALMAFAINMYNALLIHALVVHGTERYSTLPGRQGFFSKAARYNIGGSEYVLDDLEHGILRGNRPGAASVGMLLRLPGLSKGPFKHGDSRAKHVVMPVDPRIHFTLVCGAKSCPPIKLYSSDTLEEGLTAAAEAFCASDVKVDPQHRKVSLSKIFQWYYIDFGSNKVERLRFLLPYLPAAARSDLEQMLAADPEAHHIRVEHNPYDWDINAADE